MKRENLGILIIGAGLLVVMVVYKLLAPSFDAEKKRVTSETGKASYDVTFAYDDWAGYVPLRSANMRANMLASGVNFLGVNDSANYQERMQKLSEGKYDFVVATVDTYILNASRIKDSEKFPGVIMMVIDTSNGGDAIVGIGNGAVQNLDDLRGKKGLRIAYTPNSPSDYLRKAIAHDFNIPELLTAEQITTNGSEQALKKLLALKSDIAVLWEPDVSKSLQALGVVKLIGTEKTNGLIVDVLIMRRDLPQEKPGVAESVIQNYFQTLKTLTDQPDLLVTEVMKTSKVSEEVAKTVIQGVSWENLTANAERWFGVSSSTGITSQDLYDSIVRSVDVLTETKDLKSNPLPGNPPDPFTIIQSDYIKTEYGKISGGSNAFLNFNKKQFKKFTETEWNKLRPVGNLRVQNIRFRRGTYELTLDDKESLDMFAKILDQYPKFRVVIEGHTAPGDNEDANQELSNYRAQVVGKYLENNHSLDTNRYRALGYGSKKPPLRLEGETEKDLSFRKARVEIHLYQDQY